MPRRGAPIKLLDAPQKLSVICSTLRLHKDGQVFRTLAEAILRATGYGTKQVSRQGLVPIRTPSGSLTPEFQAVVRWFLISLRGGSLCFPYILPDIEGWRDCTSHEDLTLRLEWKLPKDAQTITIGVSLLFEYLKSHPDLDIGPVLYTHVWADKYNGPCKVCRRGEIQDGNAIVYCEDCGLGYHQKCHNIEEIPAGRWTCHGCQDHRDKSDPQEAEEPQAPQPRRRARTISDSDNTSRGQKRAKKSKASTKSTATAPASASTDKEVTDQPNSPAAAMIPMMFTQYEATTALLVSINTPNISRIVRLGNPNDWHELISKCTQRWELWPEQISKVLVRVPDAEGRVELDTSRPEDFDEFATIIKRAWMPIPRDVYISIILLKAGE